MEAELVNVLTTNSPFDKLEYVQKEISGMNGEIKDCNKELARVSKETKTFLNSSEIAKKSSANLEKRVKRLK